VEWRSHVCARILLDLNLVEHGRRVQREDSLNDGGRQGKGLSFVEFVAGIEGETEGLSDGGGDAGGAGDHVSPTFQIQVFFSPQHILKLSVGCAHAWYMEEFNR